MKPLYQYIGTVAKIYDGDTITDIDIDLGLGIVSTQQDIRLFGIDTFEMKDSINNKRTPEEKKLAVWARDVFRETCLGKKIFAKTFKTSKYVPVDKRGMYGRWIAKVYVNPNDLNAALNSVTNGEVTHVSPDLVNIDTVNLDDGIELICINDLFVSLGWATEEKY